MGYWKWLIELFSLKNIRKLIAKLRKMTIDPLFELALASYVWIFGCSYCIVFLPVWSISLPLVAGFLLVTHGAYRLSEREQRFN